MKIAFVNTWAGGAVYNVTKPIADELRNRGHEVDYFTLPQIELAGNNFDPTFSDYDVVHVGYFMNANQLYQECEPPMTVGVHHIPSRLGERYAQLLRVFAPARIVVSNNMAATQLGMCSITNSTVIPYAFDHTNFSTLPYPEEFTVGILGGDYESKRYHIVKQACDIANIPLKQFIRESSEDDSKDFKPQDDITDFYRSISCYAVASFDEGGPLPPQEALLCGRPVVTTRVGMMNQLITSGVNGEVYDGSPSDLARCLVQIKEEFPWYAMNARTTVVPSVHVVADMWERMFEGVVE